MIFASQFHIYRRLVSIVSLKCVKNVKPLIGTFNQEGHSLHDCEIFVYTGLADLAGPRVTACTEPTLTQQHRHASTLH